LKTTFILRRFVETALLFGYNAVTMKDRLGPEGLNGNGNYKEEVEHGRKGNRQTEEVVKPVEIVIGECPAGEKKKIDSRFLSPLVVVKK
jgi:hypothetical protein